MRLQLTKANILSSLESSSIRTPVGEQGSAISKNGSLRPAGHIDGVACRGARAMLGLSQTELCRLAKCGRNLLNEFEGGSHAPRTSSVERIRAALEGAGAVFVDAGNGTVLVGVAEHPDPDAMAKLPDGS